jgi:hypothetical protein
MYEIDADMSHQVGTDELLTSYVPLAGTCLKRGSRMFLCLTEEQHCQEMMK